MPSPFPGMDPYLETPDLWPDVHHGLISEIRAVLNSNLRPRYVARVQLRVYVSDEDDPGREAEEIEEAYLEIRHLESGSLVTVIEVLSPTNKIRGSRGQVSFMEKRRDILNSAMHWVEIDLLRAGEPSMKRSLLARSDYHILVSQAADRTRVRYWPVGVRQSLPVIGIPLRGKDADAALDLGGVLSTAYDHAAYEASIDYREEPTPPLAPEDAAWADELLRERGLR